MCRPPFDLVTNAKSYTVPLTRRQRHHWSSLCTFCRHFVRGVYLSFRNSRNQRRCFYRKSIRDTKYKVYYASLLQVMRGRRRCSVVGNRPKVNSAVYTARQGTPLAMHGIDRCMLDAGVYALCRCVCFVPLEDSRRCPDRILMSCLLFAEEANIILRGLNVDVVC